MKLQTLVGDRARSAARRREVDARALEAELRSRVRGEVRLDDGSRALYSTDGSNGRSPSGWGCRAACRTWWRR